MHSGNFHNFNHSVWERPRKEGRNPLRTPLTNSFPWSSRRKKKCIRVQASHHPNSNTNLMASNQHQVSDSSEADNDDNDSHPKSDTSQNSTTGFSGVGAPIGSVMSPLTPNQVGIVSDIKFCLMKSLSWQCLSINFEQQQLRPYLNLICWYMADYFEWQQIWVINGKNWAYALIQLKPENKTFIKFALRFVVSLIEPW